MRQYFDLHCNKCGFDFSDLLDIKKLDEKECQNCKTKGNLTRVYSGAPAIKYNGDGFYSTDYKKGRRL